CLRVAGDDEEHSDADDFHNGPDERHDASHWRSEWLSVFYRKIKTTRNSGIRKFKLYIQQEVVSQNCCDQLLIMFNVVAVKEFEGEKEFFNNGEWEERLEQWSQARKERSS
ncbi:hypothetical protein V8G54_001162, partial [Vigna mungo]